MVIPIWVLYCSSPIMSVSNNISILTQFIDEIWDHGDITEHDLMFPDPSDLAMLRPLYCQIV